MAAENKAGELGTAVPVIHYTKGSISQEGKWGLKRAPHRLLPEPCVLGTVPTPGAPLFIQAGGGCASKTRLPRAQDGSC